MYEIDTLSITKESLISKIRSVINENELPYVILRNASKLYDQDEWLTFLTKECSLTRDCRQFDADSNFLLTDWWTISYDPEKDYSYAHSKTPQPYHNDNAWFHDPAEINFFIMKKQSPAGGEQNILLVDDLVKYLKSNNPKLLNKLLETNVTIKKGDTENQYDGPIISNTTGQYQMHWNFYRTNKEDLNIKNMCNELFETLENLKSSELTKTVRLNDGDSLCIADMRLLHGRNGYSATVKDERILLQSMWRI